MRPPSCPRTLIINILRKHSDGLTLTSIAELTGLHRHTATKYIYELKGAGIINERDVGSAKLCYLKEGFKKEEEKKLIERLNGKRKERMKASGNAFFLKSSAGQVQILAVFFFLFLVPASIIIAQNATMNSSMEGGLVLENVSGTVLENATALDVPSEQDLSQESPAIFVPEQNETFQEATDSSENQTLSEIQNETILPDAGIFGNDVLGEQNNQTEAIPELPEESAVKKISGPVLEVRISSPEKITRGERLEVSAFVMNSGDSDAKNVRIFWEIPAGLEIESGEQKAECGDLPPNSECVSSLALSSSLSTDTGRSEFKILVKYEE